MRTVLLYAQVAVLTIATLVFALDLGRADLRVPLDYSVGGDVFFFVPLYKAIAETGWYTEIRAGAPGVMKLYDFPTTENGLFLGVKALILLTGNPFVAGNLFFIGGFVLAAWAAVFVLQTFGVRGQVAAAAGLLFAFQPYHLWRGTFHPNLSFYVAIPLITAVALWLCAGEPLVFRRDQAGRLRWALSLRRTLPAVGACILTALSGPYYAFFGTFLLLTGGLIGFLRRLSADRALDTIALTGFLVIGFAAQLIPNALYSARQGVNPAPSFRPLDHYYQCSLRVVDLLRPVPGHRIAALSTGLPPERIGPPADLAWLHNEVSGMASPATSLGATASCGFLVLVILGLAAPCVATRALPALGDLAHLNMAALCLGLLGGFGELMALFVTVKIRCYNRLSIFIAFFALFALAVIWDRTGRALGRDATPRRGRHWGWLALLWGMTALGLLDQIPPLLTPNHAQDAATFRSDRAFVAQIERSLPQGSMIFQLPPNTFPEFGRHFQMYDYDHFRGYLHSHHLRWSFGAIRGREVERWQSLLAPLPPAALVDRLVDAGFAGIYVARKGHEAGGKALIQGLVTKLGQPKFTSDDGQLLFFRLPGESGTAAHVFE